MEENGIERALQHLIKLEETRIAREDAAARLQPGVILAVAATLLIVGSFVVLLITGRPSLLVLVGLICCLGAGIALIGSGGTPVGREGPSSDENF
jgi:hypothetical protein